MPPSDESQPLPSSRALTWRSILLGTLAVVLTCSVTPYSDEILLNTRLAIGYLPVAVVLTLFLLAVIYNGVIAGFRKSAVLSAGELSVILGMMLVGCSPTWLMRTFIPIPIAPFQYGVMDPAFWRAFSSLHLPGWLFPLPVENESRTNPIVQWFIGNTPTGEQSPYLAWLIPLATWGVFLACLSAVLFGFASILRPQWAENERLPFPLAQLQSSLVESPEQGHRLNRLFQSKLFWTALLAVFLIHGLNGLNLFFPRTVPALPLRFDLTSIFANEPWNSIGMPVRRAGIYFTLIGVCYFIQSRTSFSLWSIWFIVQMVMTTQRAMRQELPTAGWEDQHFGANAAFTLGILWVGREHWRKFGRQIFSPSDRALNTSDLPARLAFALIILGLAGMIIWLLIAGAKLWVALAIVLIMLMAHLVVARVVAETGLPFVRSLATFQQLVVGMPAALFSGRDVFLSGASVGTGGFWSGLSPGIGVLHGQIVAERNGMALPSRKLLFGLMAWALLVGYIASSLSFLQSEYSYSQPLTPSTNAVVNTYGMEYRIQTDVIAPLNAHARSQFAAKPYTPWVQVTIGAGIVLLLQTLAMRSAAWPFMPVGFLLAMTWQADVAWFSVLIGWLSKLLLVRLGGSRMYQNVRPLFIGMIFGEALAAGLWGLATIALSTFGYEYKVYDLLPR